MALSLQQVQKQTQRLIMTPQMQQSIQLLQMNSMDLEQLIHEEMLENPLLELADDEEALDSGAADSDQDPDVELIAPEREESGLSEQAEKESAISDSDEIGSDQEKEVDYSDNATPEDPSSKSEGSEEFETFAENDVDWKETFDDSDTISYGSVREDSEENDFTTYTGAPTSLYDSLMRQLTLSVLSGKDFEIGEFLIGNLNTDGYLDCSLPNLCMVLGYPPEIITPEHAGVQETVDKKLRQILASMRGGESPDAFTGMKRKEIVLRIYAELLKSSYDELASLKKDSLYRRLIAFRLEKSYEEIEDLHESDLLLDVIGKRLEVPADRVFDVLEILHEFEPTGVAARDLGECLRLQCEEKGIRNKVLYQILDGHLKDLQQKRFREIARALEVHEDKVTEVFQILARLDPKPGRSTTKDQVQYITPDVYVKKVDGKYMYFLNEGDAGRLKVAANYRRMMGDKPNRRRGGQPKQEQANGAVSNNNASSASANGTNGHSQGDVSYASEKYKNAVWLIRNIEKRKSTILRVTEAIMEYQMEFLEKGIEHLRPLTLRDIAEKVGMHESTIARVTTKKYVETPRGLFELKYFFSSGLETDDGEAASSRSIKELLTQIIDSEDKRRPLSDQKIADMLKAKGFQIARRTVAKYREQLKILPAKLRKEVKGA